MWDLDLNGRILDVDKVLLLDELLFILNGVKPKPDEHDRFVWWRHNDGFLVKDFYKRIRESCLVESTLDPKIVKSLDQL